MPKCFAPHNAQLVISNHSYVKVFFWILTTSTYWSSAVYQTVRKDSIEQRQMAFLQKSKTITVKCVGQFRWFSNLYGLYFGNKQFPQSFTKITQQLLESIWMWTWHFCINEGPWLWNGWSNLVGYGIYGWDIKPINISPRFTKIKQHWLE